MLIKKNKIVLLSQIIMVVFLLLNTSTILAQMPLHPDLLKNIREGKTSIKLSTVTQDISILRKKGIDAPWSKVTQQLQKSTGINSFKRSYGPEKSPSGNWKALVLLVQFSDQPAQVNPNSFDNLLFAQKNRTLWDYYHQISYGSLDIVTVNLPSSIGWMTAPQTYSYYVDGQKGFGGYPRNAQKLVEDVVQMADPYVDFSKYDNDGDGEVDALFIVHTGSGFEKSGNVNDIHSHASTTSTDQNVDGVIVSHYSIEPEYWDSPGDMTIGVYAHELGHAAFGLPDLYDTDYSSQGLGYWSLMASGSWGGILGDSPSWPDAWSQIQMGFINPEVITKNQQSKTINQKETSPQILLLCKDGIVEKQYFLVENRQKTSFDSSLYNGGLLIYHVDETVKTDNTNERHYLVALEQADGLKNLENNYSGDDGDPFPGSKNNTNFSYDTNPNSLDYNSSFTGVSVKNISNPSSTMTADVEVSTTKKILQVVSPNGGEEWIVGYKKQITLLAANTGTIKLEYSTDNGISWTLIDNVEPSSTSMINSQIETKKYGLNLSVKNELNSSGNIISWVVPNLPSNKCRIKATSLSDPSITDISDNTFSIVAPQDIMTLQYDNNTNYTCIGSYIPTTLEASTRFTSSIVTPYSGWSITKLEIYIGDVPSSSKVKIYDAGTETSPGNIIYTQNFTPVADSWNIIILNTPIEITNKDIWIGYETVSESAGCYPLGVDSGPASEDGDWIYANGSWEHISDNGLDNNWNIHAICKKADYFVLLNPNGGELLKQNTESDIKWACAGVENVKLEFSSDNGVNWNNITSSVSAYDRKYRWSIPDVLSSSCKIRIKNAINETMSDESDAIFSIIKNSPIAESESNNTLETANEITYADSVDAAISPTGDIDYYKFEGAAGDTVVIYSENKAGSDLNGIIKLLDSAGNVITSNDDYVSTKNSRIVVVLPSSDTYYIRYSYVWNYNGMPLNEIKYTNLGKEIEEKRLTKVTSLTSSEDGEYRLVLNFFKKLAPSYLYTEINDINNNFVHVAGVIYPNGSPTTIKIKYGTTTSYGYTHTISDIDRLNEYGLSTFLTGLSENTLYHYKIIFVNEHGNLESADNIFETHQAPEGWVNYSMLNNLNRFNDVDFLDAENGIAITDEVFFKTTDGGSSWKNITPNVQSVSALVASGVDYVSTNKIVVSGIKMFISSDGGTTWDESDVTSNYILSKVSFIDEKTGLVVSQNGEIYKTTNGGKSWSHKYSARRNSSIWSIEYINTSIAIVAGVDGCVLKTEDGGETWTNIYDGTEFIYGVDVIDGNTYMLCGRGIFLKTIDGGKTWTKVPLGGRWYYDVKFTDPNNGMIVGWDILTTTDGGNTWIKEKTGTDNNVFGISTPVQGITYAVGDYGTILKSISEVETDLPSTPQLVFPNNDGIDLPKNIIVKWEKAKNTNSYIVELSPDSTFTVVSVKDSTVTDTTKTITGLDNNKKYYWRVRGKNSVGYGGWSEIWSFRTSVTVDMEDDKIPTEYSISQNYPNPFNPSTIFRFGLPQESRVKLSIYNILGQKVDLLVDETMSSGYHNVIWNATNYSSGVYVYRIDAVSTSDNKSWTQTKKMIFIK